MFPNLVIGLMTSIIPSVISAVLPKKEVSGAGITVTNTATTTNIGGLIVSTIMMALGASGMGADTFHMVAAVCGALGVVLTTVNHLHLTSGSNANTIALVADLMTRLSEAKLAQAGAVANVTSDASATTAKLEAAIAQASDPVKADMVLTATPASAAVLPSEAAMAS